MQSNMENRRRASSNRGWLL